ncbi:lipocalin family protein [Prevotella sp. tf2-5]|uniref:lipocalin family protein n=1 Tax=Prevotella sp. tf2-5 TaxID=1761889 RepID=UPI0008F45376|nr:lipocalin family protein [Prevotella sp. tf2-5]MCR5710924.1 lipocalin family protein [Prevotella sp.]SFO73349.1 Lipocalin-like [Prevotella sp. tf2-5]
MKKIVFVSMLMTTIVVMTSCGGKTQPVPFDNGDSTDMSAMQDPTIYGICGESTAMNTLQVVTDLGDTIQLDITYARENNQVFGGLQAGDRMAVVPNAKKTEALIVINQAALLGNWVMPNPLDGSDEVGFKIKEGGIVEGIEQSTLSYKTWRLVRGKLELVDVREGAGEEEEVNLYDIVRLSPDSLILKDGEDTYEYGRQQLKKPDSDIKLEEASEDDYKI